MRLSIRNPIFTGNTFRRGIARGSQGGFTLLELLGDDIVCADGALIRWPGSWSFNVSGLGVPLAPTGL